MAELAWCYTAVAVLLLAIGTVRSGAHYLGRYEHVCTLVGAVVLWPVTIGLEVYQWNRQRIWEARQKRGPNAD